MNQTRLGSLVETCINTAIGLILSFLAWPVAGWVFDIEYTTGQHFGIVIFFTALSIARGYVIRRWFNARLQKAAHAIAERLA